MQYTLIRSKNRRRSAALRVTASGEIVVRAPLYMPKFFLDRFVASHKNWIDKQKIKLEKARSSKPQVKHFYSVQDLQDFIINKVGIYQERTGLKPRSLKFKKVKSYWGSCSGIGVISFNIHLIYAPPEAVEYVIVHELCHLKWRGHGPRFWALVNKYYPKANEMKGVLRHIGRGERVA